MRKSQTRIYCIGIAIGIALLGAITGLATLDFEALGQRVFDMLAERDLRDLIAAQAEHIKKSPTYVSCAKNPTESDTILLPPCERTLNISLTKGLIVVVRADTTIQGKPGFNVMVRHPNGSGNTLYYHSPREDKGAEGPLVAQR